MNEYPKYNIGFLAFENFQLLDLTGPLDVFGDVKFLVKPEPNLYIIGKEKHCKVKDAFVGCTIETNVGYKDFELLDLDILIVPGGKITAIINENLKHPNNAEPQNDAWCIPFIQQQAKKVKYLIGICTGTLLLAAAGVLNGQRATTHWASLPLLNLFPDVLVSGGYPRYELGAQKQETETGILMTAGGVTSGIDASLALIAIIYGEEIAKQTQLFLQYQPEPPFQSGVPNTADPTIVASVLEPFQDTLATRYEIIKQFIAEST